MFNYIKRQIFTKNYGGKEYNNFEILITQNDLPKN